MLTGVGVLVTADRFRLRQLYLSRGFDVVAVRHSGTLILGHAVTATAAGRGGGSAAAVASNSAGSAQLLAPVRRPLLHLAAVVDGPADTGGDHQHQHI